MERILLKRVFYFSEKTGRIVENQDDFGKHRNTETQSAPVISNIQSAVRNKIKPMAIFSIIAKHSTQSGKKGFHGN